jgi:uncharacterized protein
MIYIAFLILTFLVLIFAFYQWQYFMIFSPTYYRGEILPQDCELLSVISDDGKELEGVCYSPFGAISTVLFFAGRSHDSVGLIEKLSLTYPKTQIITFNYRSYGKSQGKVSEKNILKDALKIAEIVQRNYGDFYILGFSLGSSVAAYVASRHKTEGLFLIGAFDSIASLARSKYVDRGRVPYINLSRVFRYKFRTGVSVETVEADTYLFVSVHDEITYIENARELKKKIKNLVWYVELDDLTHKDILWDKEVTSKIREVVE